MTPPIRLSVARAFLCGIACGIALSVMLAACGRAGHLTLAPPPAPPPRTVPHSHAIKTVFLIVMENHNWSAIFHSAAAPYINLHLLPHASYATQYYNPRGVHPSLPNYLWLEAGTNCFPGAGCIRDDAGPSAHTIVTLHHLTALLSRAHLSWRAYEEGISGTGCPTGGGGGLLQAAAATGLPAVSHDNLYAVRHDPFVYFLDVRRSAACVHNIRPFAELARDLRRGTVARYNFITPNVCDDMHTACPFFSNPVKQGDTWLSHVVPEIMASGAYRRGGAIFITWDEGEGGDGPIGMIVLSPFAKGRGYHNATHYTHSSTLRTLEEIFSVRPFLGGAASAADLRALFWRFP